jgi:SAM-dependent methyltransferase
MSETHPSDERGDIDAADQRRAVRERYGDIAAQSGDCWGEADGTDSCCGPAPSDADDVARRMGYSTDAVSTVPEGANLGLGCGNPTALAALDAGETVLDLGSGAGFDCFLAAEEVGPTGRVVGVDMTPEMIETARENAAESDTENVEFRLGEIEHLPVADAAVDVVISNCVVNLSPAKARVFSEAYRVLRPGGRLSISDIVKTTRLPADVRTDLDSLTGCVAGASRIAELDTMLTDAGFEAVSIEPADDSEEFISEWDAERDLSDYVVSATIEAHKPNPT